MKLVIGKEYLVQGRYAKLENFSETWAVLRDRWDNQFECDVSNIQEKSKVTKNVSVRRKSKKV